MAPRAESTPVERLRAAVATRVDAVGLRPVAREIGMDPRGITKLLNGAHPRAATRQKLERWYTVQVAEGGDVVDSYAAAAALQVLVQDLSPAHRSQAVTSIVACLEGIYSQRKTPAPMWLKQMRG